MNLKQHNMWMLPAGVLTLIVVALGGIMVRNCREIRRRQAIIQRERADALEAKASAMLWLRDHITELANERTAIGPLSSQQLAVAVDEAKALIDMGMDEYTAVETAAAFVGIDLELCDLFEAAILLKTQSLHFDPEVSRERLITRLKQAQEKQRPFLESIWKDRGLDRAEIVEVRVPPSIHDAEVE